MQAGGGTNRQPARQDSMASPGGGVGKAGDVSGNGPGTLGPSAPFDPTHVQQQMRDDLAARLGYPAQARRGTIGSAAGFLVHPL